MKKALSCLLIALMLVPITMMAQRPTKAGQVVTQNVTSCGAYTWAIDGVTYNHNTVEMFTRNDTTYVLNLTVVGNVNTVLNATASCVYTYGRLAVSNDTVLVDSLTSMNGCDSVVTINVHLTHINYDTIHAINCVGYTFGGIRRTMTGIYTYNTTNDAYGCDSVHVLDLTVQDTMKREVSATRCGSYTWALNDSTYTVSTKDTAYIDAAGLGGCDSMIILTVNITYNRDTIVDSACAQYKVRTKTFTETGDYFDTTYVSGCPTYKVYQLRITPRKSVVVDSNVTSCGSISLRFVNVNRDTLKYYDSVTRRTTEVRNIYNGVAITNNSRVRVKYSINDFAQCVDSAINVNVHLNKSKSHVESIESCDSYLWDYTTTYAHDTVIDTIKHKHTFNETGRDSVKIGRTAQGCDSFYVMSVKINISPVITSVQGKYKLSEGQETKLYAEADKSGLKYTWTYNGRTVTTDTLRVKYSDISGNTDVTVRAEDRRTHCYGESWITILYGVGINDVDNVGLKIYPNPTAQILNVNCNEAISTAVVYNMLGAKVMEQNMTTGSVINVSGLPKGVYSLRLMLQNGKSVATTFTKNK